MTDNVDLDAIEARAGDWSIPDGVIRNDVEELTAEVRRLREEIAAVFAPIMARLKPEDVDVFQGYVPRPGYPRRESTERLVAEGLLVNFETDTPLGKLFHSYLTRNNGAAMSEGTQP